MYLIQAYRRNLDSLFDSFALPTIFFRKSVNYSPDFDLKETESHYLISADLPGMEQKDIDINIEKKVITISGKREESREIDQQGLYRCERRFGSFSRSFSIQDDIDINKVTATYKNGVLEVSLPKTRQIQSSKRIEITS